MCIFEMGEVKTNGLLHVSYLPETLPCRQMSLITTRVHFVSLIFVLLISAVSVLFLICFKQIFHTSNLCLSNYRKRQAFCVTGKTSTNTLAHSWTWSTIQIGNYTSLSSEFLSSKLCLHKDLIFGHIWLLEHCRLDNISMFPKA